MRSYEPPHRKAPHTSAPEGPPYPRPGIQLAREGAPEPRIQTETFIDSYMDLEKIEVPDLGAMALTRTPHLQLVLSRARRARDYLGILACARQHLRLHDAARVLSSIGCGVAYVVSDNHRVHEVDIADYVHKIRHTLGLVPEATIPFPHRCPICTVAQDAVRDDPTNDAHLAMADHVPRCPVRGLTTQLHDIVRSALMQLLKEHTSLSTQNIVVEPTVMTDNARRPAKVMLRNFHGQNKHLILEVEVTSSLTNIGLSQEARDPGSTARAYERRKILALHANPVTMRGSWWYVPFVLEDCGRPGVQALAFLAEVEKLYLAPQASPGIRIATKTVISPAPTSAVY